MKKKEIYCFLYVLTFFVGLSLINMGHFFWGGILIYIFAVYGIKFISTQEKDEKYCYRLRVNISPNWQALLGVKPEERVSDYSADYRKMMKDEKFEFEGKHSLLGKSFSYVVFVDERSGMKQIYDNIEKCFVNDLEVVGRLIEYLECDDTEKIVQKHGYSEDVLHQEIEVSPYGLSKYRRDNIMPWYKGDEKEGDHLSAIPFYDIVKGLRKLFKDRGNPMCGILKFPNEIQKSMDEHKVKYLTRDFHDAHGEYYGKPQSKEADKRTMKAGFKFSNDRMLWHTFDTEYLQVSINLKRLDGYDIDFDLDFSSEGE